MQQHNSETWWRRTTATLMGVSIRTYRRRDKDVLMGHRGYVPLRDLGGVPMSLGVSFETCLGRREDVPMRRRCYILLRSCHDVPIRCCGDVPLRRLGDVPSRRRGVFLLRHSATSLGWIERRCYNVATASSCRVGTVLKKLFCQTYLFQFKWML